MVRLAMRQGTHDGDFVRDLGRLFQQLGEMNPIEFRFDRAERTAIFDRRQQFRVKGFLCRHATWEINIDNRFGRAFLDGGLACA